MKFGELLKVINPCTEMEIRVQDKDPDVEVVITASRHEGNKFLSYTEREVIDIFPVNPKVLVVRLYEEEEV